MSNSLLKFLVYVKKIFGEVKHLQRSRQCRSSKSIYSYQTGTHLRASSRTVLCGAKQAIAHTRISTPL